MMFYSSHWFIPSLGNVYFSDGSYRVRKVTVSTGLINIIAGTGTYGYSGDGGAATSAKFKGAYGVVVDSSGTIDFTLILGSLDVKLTVVKF